jgi:uncharacterized tellurite resistance protein B-like protein
MAMHDQLPIYKIAFDLLSLATDLTRNMPRDLKAGLGAEVRAECIKMLMSIARANSNINKIAHITDIIERNDVVKFLLRLFKEKRYISIKQHAAAIELIESISKQANGWKKKYAASPVI